MKRILTISILAVLMAIQVSAQDKPQVTLNTRAWCTNYFTTALYDLASIAVKSFAFNGCKSDSMLGERLIPIADLVFPVGMGKKGFDGTNEIYGPYHYAFGNPFKHIGDWGVGFDASYKPSLLGFYAGAYFKSQEIVFKDPKDNLRGFYFQPRGGIILGSDKSAIEAGVFYDVVTGCAGSVPVTDTKRLQNGLGLDFALSWRNSSRKSMTQLQFSMPLHNFLDTDFPGQQGMKRKVGYIRLTRRVML